MDANHVGRKIKKKIKENKTFGNELMVNANKIN